jgi:exonuclease SbcC
MKASLHKDEHYTQALAQLQVFEAAMAATVYDSTQSNQLQQELESITILIQSYDELTKQVTLQPTRQEQVHMLVLRLKKINKDIQEMKDKKNKFQTLHMQDTELARLEQELLHNKTELNKQKEVLLQERGGIERECAKLKALEKEAEGCKKQIAEINDHIDDYQAIATATGKDGIQALLIQDILPEIEQEANELLAKLTDNQAQIFIESLRDLKKGGAKETLDINISDTMGIRPYEMFSGGEAFRIDFALRIALSKMLARRAGTSLQTLIIDEGFGSQDEEGLVHIMDALYRIQDDFAKVIIVSHLTSMKDQFPVHFYIEKKPSGSVVSVVEQG